MAEIPELPIGQIVPTKPVDNSVNRKHDNQQQENKKHKKEHTKKDDDKPSIDEYA